jgi:hypothetical protein
VSSTPLSIRDARAAHAARWEAIAAARAQEIAALTDDRVRDIIQSLGAVDRWRDRDDWSGLVEQQAILQRGRRR